MKRIAAFALVALAITSGVASGQPSERQIQEILELRAEARRFEVAAIFHEEQLVANGGEPGAAYAAHAGVARGLGNYIAQLEAYLEESGANAEIAPHVLDLLADLYLDRAQALDGAAAYAVDDAGVDTYDGDHAVIAEAMAIEMWERIAGQFPEYSELGEVLRRLAASYLDMAQNDDAKRALQQLLCSNRRKEIDAADQAQDREDDDLKARLYAGAVGIGSYESCVPLIDDPALVEEAWVALGHVHRSTFGEADLAIAALSHVTVNNKSPEYVGAAQELAAAYLDNGMLIEAIPVLDELVLYLDKSEAGDPLAAELRAESIAEIARILARLWQESALPDQGASLKLATIYYHSGRHHQAHVRDVFDSFGAALREFGAYEQAIPVWRHTIETWPTHEATPVAYDKLVQLLIEKGDNAAADRERRRLLQTIREGSRWRKANADHSDVVASAFALGEKTLFTLASNEARQARLAFAARTRDAAELYASAAVLLEQFMSDYPDSEHTYDLNMLLGEVYYFAGRMDDAGRAFRQVRDARPGGKHFEKAAHSATVIYEEAISNALSEGTMTMPQDPGKDLLASSPEPLDKPALIVELQAAYDAWVEYAPDMTAPGIALNAALLDLRYLHVAAAEKRLKTVVDDHCHSPAANEARDLLVTIYEARGDDDAAKELGIEFLKNVCGDSQPVRVVRSVKIERDYGTAEQHFNDGKFADAGRSFYKVHTATDANHKYHAEALFRAAESMELAGRTAAASSLWSELTDNEAMHASPLYAEALLHEALAHRAAYDYESAVTAYLELSAVAANKSYVARSSFDLAAEAHAGLLQAAELRELDRVYYDRGANDPGAGTLFIRYAKAESDPVQASEAFLRAAAVYENAGDGSRLTDIYREWELGHADFKGADIYHVRFQFKIAKALEKAGDRRGALKSFAQVVDAYDKAKQPGPGEQEMAGESQFWLAEQKFRLFDRYEFQWPQELTQKAVEAAATPLLALSEEAVAEFQKVGRLSSSWGIAASVRVGDIAWSLAQKLVSSPIPTSVDEADFDANILDTFVDLVAEIAGDYYANASREWERAVTEAAQLDVSNEWSRNALERLNNYAPDRWPMVRDEIIAREVTP